MPRAGKAPKIDPDGIYECWMSGSALVDGEDVYFSAGQRLRGDSPIVQACSHFFIPDGGEPRSAWTAVVERTDAERTPPEYEVTLSGPVPEVLEGVDTVRLTRDVVVRAGYVAGREVVRFSKGDHFAARSELAGLLPDDAFEPVKGREIRKPRGRK